jgi:membrane-associated phospholipid phosphatase
MIGIPWSRLVLAAHYGTDVTGGILFGVAWLCLMLVVLGHVPVLGR